MTVLKLRAVDLDHGTRVSQECFRGGLDNSRFSRARRAQKQEIANRTPGSSHPSQMHLVYIHDLLNRFFLAHDELAQTAIEHCRFPPCFGRI